MAVLLLVVLEAVVMVVKTVVPQGSQELQILEVEAVVVLIQIRLAPVVDQVL
jgi:hypothetical protein